MDIVFSFAECIDNTMMCDACVFFKIIFSVRDAIHVTFLSIVEWFTGS